MTLGRGRVLTLAPGSRGVLVHKPVSNAALGYVTSQDCVDAAQSAKQILAATEAAAATRLEEADRQLDQIRNEIREQVEAELAFEHTKKLLELGALRRSVLERAENEIAQLAGVLAQRIIGEELSLDPEKQVTLACQVLRDVGGAERVTIYAAPDSVAVLQQGLCRLEATISARIEVVPDSNLTRGDLRIDTDIGSIDARLGTQLSYLVAAIVDSLHS
jgi:flagellar biosynthesis/type III secretory pathway protein FliH